MRIDDIQIGSENVLENNDEKSWLYINGGDELFTYDETRKFTRLINLWKSMDVLKFIYEESCREWFLPTCYILKNNAAV